MRGLKHEVIHHLLRVFDWRRAVCPANEGIETSLWLRSQLSTSRSSRAVCPANEGIETDRQRTVFVLAGDFAARSAPLMRGLKHPARLDLRNPARMSRAVCPANEGIETSLALNP